MYERKIIMADEKKKGIISEFKEFIARGNVVDMAVGIIMGGAFTPIVNSLVNDIVMPGIGLVVGKMNFSDLKIVLQQGAAADEAAGIEEIAEVAVAYGNFIQVILNFIIVAFCVFMHQQAETQGRTRSRAGAAGACADCRRTTFIGDTRSFKGKERSRPV